MPGTMLVQAATLAGLPTSGTAWDRLVAASEVDPGDGNLTAANQQHPLAVLAIALRWAKDGGGLGKTFVINEIKAVMGTEATSTGQDPYRALAAYILAADLVDMPGSEVGANGQTFDAWMQSWPTKEFGNSANSTLYKAARTGPHHQASFARTSLFAVCLWLLKRGLNPSPTTGIPATTASLRDDVVNFYKRWLGDTTVPNTFTVPGYYNAAWAVNTFPTTQGAINPETTDTARDGANVIEASVTGAPPLVGESEGLIRTYESLDAADTMLILLINAGYGSAAGWGNNALRRAYQFLINNNLTGLDTYTSGSYKYFAHQPWFANYVWNLNMPTATVDGSQRRLLTTHVDWLTSPGSTWLTTSGDGGGGTPVITNPSVSLTLTRVDQTVTADVTGTAQGSSALARHEINWGDGSPVQTITEPSRTAQRTYVPTSGGQTYTVTATAVATDGGSAAQSKAITVPSADGSPVAVFVIDKTLVAPGDVVSYDFAGSFDPAGGTLTRMVNWGDGIAILNANPTGSHTYADVAEPTSYIVTGQVFTDTQESAPVKRVVTVMPAAAGRRTAEMWLGTDTGPVPFIPAYSSTWDGLHLRMGTIHVWYDGVDGLRWKDGAPIGATDGQLIGSGGGTGVVVVAPGAAPPAGTPAGTVIVESTV